MYRKQSAVYLKEVIIALSTVTRVPCALHCIHDIITAEFCCYCWW